MNSDPSYIQSLFLKYSQGSASSEEVRELFTELLSDKNDEQVVAYMQEQMSEVEPKADFDVQRWGVVLDRIKSKRAPEETVEIQKSSYPFKWRAAIAAAIAVIFFGVWLYTSRHAEFSSASPDYANDIAPGKQGATLTLANGKKILLSDAAKGNIVTESGVIITKTMDGRLIYEHNTGEAVGYNILSTAKGQNYEVHLADGSIVFLNAASSLKYPSSFAKLKERGVELSGEAYFMVKHNVKQPFRVISGKQIVEDIGTEFNINNYADESSIQTTLVEGSARVSSLPYNGLTSNDVILKPNQQSVLAGNAIKVQQVGIEQVIAWKSGDFYFKSEPLESVMRKVARWYNITVEYSDVQMKLIPLSGQISRTKPLSSVLERIGAAGHLRFTRSAQKIFVLPED